MYSPTFLNFNQNEHCAPNVSALFFSVKKLIRSLGRFLLIKIGHCLIWHCNKCFSSGHTMIRFVYHRKYYFSVMFHLLPCLGELLCKHCVFSNKIFIRRIQKRTLNHLCISTKEHSYKEVNLYLYIYIFIILRAVHSNWYNPFDLSMHTNISTKTKLFYYNNRYVLKIYDIMSR